MTPTNVPTASDSEGFIHMASFPDETLLQARNMNYEKQELQHLVHIWIVCKTVSLHTTKLWVSAKCECLFMSVCVFLCLNVSEWLPLFSGEFVCVWEDQNIEETVKFLLWYLDKNFLCLRSCSITNEWDSHIMHILYMYAHHKWESVFLFSGFLFEWEADIFPLKFNCTIYC